jgi:hypothetical protein
MKLGHNWKAIDTCFCRLNLYRKSFPYTYIGDLANHSAGCRHAGASVNQHRCIVAKISIPTSCDRNSSHLKVFFVVFHGNMPICIDALATHKDLQCHESVGLRSGISLHLQARLCKTSAHLCGSCLTCGVAILAFAIGHWEGDDALCAPSFSIYPSVLPS